MMKSYPFGSQADICSAITMSAFPKLFETFCQLKRKKGTCRLPRQASDVTHDRQNIRLFVTLITPHSPGTHYSNRKDFRRWEMIMSRIINETSESSRGAHFVNLF